MLENLRTFIEDLRDARAARRDDRGASAVEYGLLVAGIAALVVTVVFLLGGNVREAFNDTNDCIAGNGAAANCPANVNP